MRTCSITPAVCWRAVGTSPGRDGLGSRVHGRGPFSGGPVLLVAGGGGRSAAAFPAAAAAFSADHFTRSSPRLPPVTSRGIDSVDQLPQRIEFVGSQSPVLTDFQSAQAKRPEGDPLETHHLVPDSGHQPTDLPVASLSQFQLQEGALATGLQFPGGMHLEETIRKMESVAECLETGRGSESRRPGPGRFSAPGSVGGSTGAPVRRRWSR